VPGVIFNARIVKSGSGPGPSDYAAAMRDPRAWSGAVGEVLIEDIEQRFQTETDPWGNAWAALSPVTLKLRAALGRSGRILSITRNLANSKFSRLEGVRLVVGMAAKYAAAQMLGNPANKMYGKWPAPIPARAALPLRPGGRLDMPQRLLVEIKETISDAIRIAASKAA